MTNEQRISGLVAANKRCGIAAVTRLSRLQKQCVVVCSLHRDAMLIAYKHATRAALNVMTDAKLQFISKSLCGYLIWSTKIVSSFCVKEHLNCKAYLAACAASGLPEKFFRLPA